MGNRKLGIGEGGTAEGAIKLIVLGGYPFATST